MSLMEKLKSMFAGGSSDAADGHDHSGHDHAGHDHAGHDHSDEPAATPAADPAPSEEGENRLN